MRSVWIWWQSRNWLTSSTTQGQGTRAAPLPEETRYVDQEVWRALLGGL